MSSEIVAFANSLSAVSEVASILQRALEVRVFITHVLDEHSELRPPVSNVVEPQDLVNYLRNAILESDERLCKEI